MKKELKIKCKRCGTERIYKGEKIKLMSKYPQFVKCNKCFTSIKLIDQKSQKLKNKK